MKPNAHNCNLYWKEYENLKPDSINSAYPWVIDYYYANQDIWKEINEQHYDWYLECVPPIRMSSSSFLNGEPYTHTNEGKGLYLACKCQNGKYYAQLMTRSTNISAKSTKIDSMKTNTCKICQNSIMNEGICLGLAKNSDYSQFVPINMHSPLLEDWIIGNLSS